MNLQDYLKADRQWPRVHRIAHARYQLASATSRRAKNFWEAVLRANGRWVNRKRKRRPVMQSVVQLKEAA